MSGRVLDKLEELFSIIDQFETDLHKNTHPIKQILINRYQNSGLIQIHRLVM